MANRDGEPLLCHWASVEIPRLGRRTFLIGREANWWRIGMERDGNGRVAHTPLPLGQRGDTPFRTQDVADRTGGQLVANREGDGWELTGSKWKTKMWCFGCCIGKDVDGRPQSI